MKNRLKWLIFIIIHILFCLVLSVAIAETSGSCGNSLIWILEDDGTLTISGSGKMNDYYYHSCGPWGNSVREVYISEGVTSIGNRAFFGCNNLITITIPNSVTSIGEQAFIGCNKLMNVTIPNNLVSIGWSAFSSCSSITRITLPKSVNSIGNYAFSDCTNLKSINVSEGNEMFASRDGVLFDKNFDTLICCPGGKDGTYVIPNSVTKLREGAFRSCENLSHISIPNSVSSIGEGAFYNCRRITSIIIPSNVVEINESLFCECKMLMYVNILGNVTSINKGAFFECQNLKHVNIPDSVVSIGFRAFEGCKSLEYVTIPESVNIIDERAFYACNNLSHVAFLGGENDSLIIHAAALGGTSRTIYCYMFSPADDWCAEKGITPIYLDDLDISTIRTISVPNDLRLACKDRQKISAQVFPDLGDTIVWQSSNPEVVSVEDADLVAASPGTSTITATVGNVSNSLNVEVYTPATSFQLSSDEIWITAKNSVQLLINNIEPADAEATFYWSSSDSSLASVDSSGLVTTIKPGDVTITAISEKNVTRSCLLHLSYPVTNIDLFPEATVIKGDTLELTANVTARTQHFTNKLITFECADESIATVDMNGIVTGHTLGTTTITAIASNGVFASCVITVRDAYALALPETITAIEDEAFMNDISLEKVIIPTSCVYIGNKAFAGCINLKYILIPEKTIVAPDAFNDCSGVVIERSE